MYLDQNILDDSKLIMSSFHYNFMMNKVDHDIIKLLFTDTDSLCYHIKKQDIFQIIKNNKDEFDLSNYAKDHELYDGKNSKVIGKMKNESPKQITEFVGMRSKLYNYTVDNDDDNHVRCKVSKVLLNCYDTKRYIRNNIINTLSFGHKDIRQNKI